MPDTCATCRFAHEPPNLKGALFCRRNPPTWSIAPMPAQPPSPRFPNGVPGGWVPNCTFARTEPAEWCGEHQPAPPAIALQ